MCERDRKDRDEYFFIISILRYVYKLLIRNGSEGKTRV